MSEGRHVDYSDRAEQRAAIDFLGGLYMSRRFPHVPAARWDVDELLRALLFDDDCVIGLAQMSGYCVECMGQGDVHVHGDACQSINCPERRECAVCGGKGHIRTAHRNSYSLRREIEERKR